MASTNKRSSGFTLKSQGGLLREIISEALVFPFGIQPEVTNTSDPRLVKTGALWDTGATNCAITSALAAKLNLKPTGITEVHYGNGVHRTNVYLVDLILPNKVHFKCVRMTECANSNSFGLIIGMDVISRGDFAITNVGGNTTVSFRVPSQETIDYVEEIDKKNAALLSPTPQNRAERRRANKK